MDRSRFRLLGPDGDRSAPARPSAEGAESMTCDGLALGPGAYTIEWTSVAADGDIERGKLTFTVNEPTPAPPTPTPAPSQASAAPSASPVRRAPSAGPSASSRRPRRPPDTTPVSSSGTDVAASRSSPRSPSWAASAPSSSAAAAPPDHGSARARGRPRVPGASVGCRRPWLDGRRRPLVALLVTLGSRGRRGPRPVAHLPEPAAPGGLPRRARRPPSRCRSCSCSRATSAPTADRRPGRVVPRARGRCGSPSASIGLAGWTWIVAQAIAGGSSDASVATLFLWVFGWVGIAMLSALAVPGLGVDRPVRDHPRHPRVGPADGRRPRLARLGDPRRACGPGRPCRARVLRLARARRRPSAPPRSRWSSWATPC